MSSFSSLPYRPGVGIILLNATKNRVWVGKRIDTSTEAWQMPQGGIDAGETPHEAALREMLEEIGTNNATPVAESDGWYKLQPP